MKQAPTIEIGIMTANEIRFNLNGVFNYDNQVFQGQFIVRTVNGKIRLEDYDNKVQLLSDNLYFIPLEKNSSFTLSDVTIGIGFHWQKKENQSFNGALKFIVKETEIIGINVISVEEYLISVISSEMSATSSLEMLKAHAVISRSWLLSQIEKRKTRKNITQKNSGVINNDEIVRWYDRQDHAFFDVCADDHCQRYQGITRASTAIVIDAVEQTNGQVLIFNDSICDARFSKCCGGVTERFENVWEPVNHPYLEKIYDSIEGNYDLKDLSIEENARNWIISSPPAFCNTNDKMILSQVLNDYDQETHDFYRWSVEYSGKELGDLIKSKTGIDFGLITEMIPIERGVSGRIIRLKIVGSKKTMVIGKELEIRKALSATHLYSSAFIVEKKNDNFMLRGAGWGHGVGLCQIGAAVMGAKGYGYREILSHYYKGAEVKNKY